MDKQLAQTLITNYCIHPITDQGFDALLQLSLETDPRVIKCNHPTTEDERMALPKNHVLLARYREGLYVIHQNDLDSILYPTNIKE